jgi:hypothetical protein
LRPSWPVAVVPHGWPWGAVTRGRAGSERHHLILRRRAGRVRVQAGRRRRIRVRRRRAAAGPLRGRRPGIARARPVSRARAVGGRWSGGPPPAAGAGAARWREGERRRRRWRLAVPLADAAATSFSSSSFSTTNTTTTILSSSSSSSSFCGGGGGGGGEVLRGNDNGCILCNIICVADLPKLRATAPLS